MEVFKIKIEGRLNSTEVQIKYEDSEGNWIDLYPKTLANMVLLRSGMTVENTVASLIKQYNTAKSMGGIAGEKGDKGDRGEKGDRGDPFVYEDFTTEQLLGLKGEKGDKGDRGEKGDGLDYSTMTPEEIASITGEKGDKGDPFIYEDFTPQQLADLKGEKGDTGERGLKGDPFIYGDFTPQQLADLKGEKGDKGDKGDTGLTGEKGDKGDKGDRGLTGERGLRGYSGYDGVDGDDGIHSSGSGLYGTFVKFNDGTMICQRTVNIDRGITTEQQFNFNQPFIRTPYVGISHQFGANITYQDSCRSIFIGADNIIWRLSVGVTTTVGQNFEAYLFAIGRWK